MCYMQLPLVAKEVLLIKGLYRSISGGVQDGGGLANELQIGANRFIWQVGQQARKLRQRSCLTNAIFRGFT